MSTQDSIEKVWAKYRKSLNSLETVLEENEKLKKDLEIDFTMPDDIVNLERKVESQLAEYESKE